MRYPSFVSCLLVGSVWSCGGDSAPDDPPEVSTRPNVVLITLDTLRPDHLDVYGYGEETAPYLASLGRRGTVFTRAYSTSSWTAPSTASLFTGRYPHEHGIAEGFYARARRGGDIDVTEALTVTLSRLPQDLPTLPELFHDEGWRTFGVTTNPNVGPELGFDRSFDRFVQMNDADASEVEAVLVEWQDEIEAAEPSFLYLHLNDIHGPYVARAPWYRERTGELEDIVARYDSEIAYVDRTLSSLHERFAWDDDTLVFVVSDHGEEFRDHGAIGHRATLYEELTRVVMLGFGPGVGVQRAAPLVSLVDVLPTLADLAGLPQPQSTGRTLRPLMQPGDTDAAWDERVLFAHRLRSTAQDPVDLWAAMRGRWKLSADPVRSRLYDVEADRLETKNLARVQTAEAERLRAALDAARAEGFRQETERVELKLSPDRLELLRRLGYVETTPPDDDAGTQSSDGPR